MNRITSPAQPLANPLRRSLLVSSAASAAAAFSRPALAQFRVEISGVGGTQLPIAIADFRDEALAGQSVAGIVRADLERSGQFRMIAAPAGLSETISPNFNEWRGKQADALAAGSVARLADGRLDVRYKLWDVVRGQDQGGEAQAVHPDDVRLAAHRIADSLYQKLTGDRGVFATRMAYVTKTGPRYQLRITDADGEGGQVALNSPEPIISPAWSPEGREIAYVSFESRKAVVWLQDLSTGRRRVLADFRGSNSAPAFSPDGQRLALTLSLAGGSQLFTISRSGGDPKRLSQTRAIDTEPVYSPDGAQIYFVSDRGGAPQIYRMPANGGEAERVTFSGSYNISPAISPDGKTLAFITREGGSTFRLCVMDLVTGQSQKITDSTEDESPSFAPNGKLIVYATRAGGRDVLMTTTLDGRIKAKLVASTADVREPTWGPFGR
ncbi:Tol-Pal system protein TolB [Mitsuaria sp. WAJ17]|uniref:Tol-Pal system beta propeller repeat protein TolB n=1 Tax=Mitsuaria sp. WAJ17 TaxID=2761452 RepID=UPI00160413C7|nr:Tol-Pal system beta propeller repeat protein TolB [Mitsuaria sp. WAJ17]MBB2485520.1 Tol-Pal system protein TolB [Mitsuaria sp. WAJ17]